jgi:hypothetical protein
MKVRYSQLLLTALACALLTVSGCDSIGENEALTRGTILVDSVGQEGHAVQIGNDADVTDDDGDYSISAASTGSQPVEIISPLFEDPMMAGAMITESCLVVDVEIVKPITVLQFNLVREMNGDISGTINTLTNAQDETILIAPFSAPSNCF